MSSDVFTQEIIKDALVAVGYEMFDAMIRTSMSPIIYETTDFAVGVTDARGNLLAQGNGVAAFLATLDTAVQSTLLHYPKAGDVLPGDVIITNIPYEGGGTHLSDVVILVPVFHEHRLIAWTVNKAHWTEVGGAQAGSVSTNASEIFQEGLQFPFIKLYEQGRLNEALVAVIRANVRLPESTIGDMHAGVAAARVGARRVSELVDKYGVDHVVAAMDGLLDYGERMTREELARLPAGTYEAQDVVETDGVGGGPFTIKVKVTISAQKITVDYTGSCGPAKGPINCSYTGLVTGVRCVFKAITNPEIPANGGCFRLLEIICPKGTLISAQAPAPVSLYYEPLITAMDVMWKALAPVMPERLPAGHQRAVNATFVAGIHPDTKELFVMGEPLVGGWGGASGRDGDGGQFCCANGETYNIPTELFESRYGLKVEQYAFHDEDGGAGQFRGGKGVVLDYRVTADEAFVTYASSRTQVPPWGSHGGQPGSLNGLQIIRSDGSVSHHEMCTAVRVAKGELIRLTTATGGGFGDPRQRPRELVERDLRNGYVTPEQARRDYGHVAAR
ncbi:MAG: hydantoinase B/oxoprolinase family protein [Proteobacteria bacterium]|nr:hydantoinase B/oxoprolinase family protein [Pseudomonadota bacterium]